MTKAARQDRDLSITNNHLSIFSNVSDLKQNTHTHKVSQKHFASGKCFAERENEEKGILF